MKLEKLSKTNQGIVLGAKAGYKFINGKVYNPKGNEVAFFLHRDKGNYKSYKVSFYIDGNAYTIRLHRFIAYQKFGDEIFEPGQVVRHLDGDSLNNDEDNIDLGTQKDNMQDIPSEKRIERAYKGWVTRYKKFYNA